MRMCACVYLANICLNQWCLARKFSVAILLEVLAWHAETFQYVLMRLVRKIECVNCAKWRGLTDKLW